MYSPMMLRPTDVDTMPVTRTPILSWASHTGDPGTTLGHAVYYGVHGLDRASHGLLRGLGASGRGAMKARAPIMPELIQQGLGRGGGGGSGAHAGLRGFDDFGVVSVPRPPLVAQRAIFGRGQPAVWGRGQPFYFTRGRLRGFGEVGVMGAARGGGARGRGGGRATHVHGFDDLGRGGGGGSGAHAGLRGFGELAAARGGGARGGRGGRSGGGMRGLGSHGPILHRATAPWGPNVRGLGYPVDVGPRAPWFPGIAGLGQDDLTPVDIVPVDTASATLPMIDVPVDASTTTNVTVTPSGLPDTWGTASPTDWISGATSALKFASTAASAVLPYFGVTPKRPTPPAGYAYSSTGQLIRLQAPATALSRSMTPILIVGGLAAAGGLAWYLMK